MARLEDIRGLAESHASSISSSPRDWMNYLDTAARLYRYPFMDQFLIHAQRPQATACASLELWNQKMFRWVNRGAKGIALIDETTQKTRLRYVFDVQDTHMVNGGRTPYLWKLQEEQQEAPTDAYLTDDGTSYVIVPETEGEQVDYEKAEQAVIEALDAGAASVDLEEKDVYRKPGITQDDEALNGEMAELNHLTAARITYAIGENSYAIDRATLQSWLVQGEDGTYTISQDEAAAFVRHMAYETDTFGLAHTFKTSLGATINLNAGGDYGWCIDKEETTQALLQAIEDETQGNLDPVYLYTANDRSANDIGNTYVEVCISQQKMWCYKDGVLVTETPVTTGNHATGYDTPAGSVWAVDAKKSDCDFKLYPSHVMFWLPFNGDVGIHDASWRTEYGGDIYLTNGSHGCVNTPYTEAEKVFNAIEIGDPVIVYYSLDDVTGPQPTQKNSL